MSAPTTRPRIPVATKLALLHKQRHCCADCHQKLEGTLFDVDHVVPRCISADDSIGNLQILCPTCHARKSRSELGPIWKFKKMSEPTSRIKLCWGCKHVVSPYFWDGTHCSTCRKAVGDPLVASMASLKI